MTVTMFPIIFLSEPFIIVNTRNGYSGTDMTPCNIAKYPAESYPDYYYLWRTRFFIRQSASAVGDRQFEFIAFASHIN